MKRTISLLLLSCSCALLMSCNSISTNKAASRRYQLTAAQYQQLADTSTGEERLQALLHAAQRQLQNNNQSAAQKTLSQINQAELTPQLTIQKQLIEADIALQNQQPKKSIALLNQAAASNAILDPSTAQRLQKLLATAYFETGQYLAGMNDSAQALQSMTNDNEEKQQYLSQIWQNLQAIPDNQLNTLQQQANNNYQRGWLALITITHDASSANKLLSQVQSWQSNYPNHPAQQLISSLSAQKMILPSLPNKIALLLPLNGALAKQGTAIRNGFFAAYYQSKSQGFSPDIKVYDTSQGNVNTLYTQAISDGAAIVIGPLLKSNIESLITQQKLNIPTIALNTIPSEQKIPNLYQFGLSPDDEASQVAEKIWTDQHQRILIIKPDSAWGNRINTAFSTQWQQLGGQIADQMDYHSRAKLAHQTRALLNVDQSQHRTLVMRWLLKEKIRSVPRRRADFDAIFLIATPRMGRQIMPLLQFYYANNVPVYSISDIYQSRPNPKLDHDLNGVIFDDMPWVITAKNALPSKLAQIRESAKEAWPKSFMQYSRFYALGSDAFNLVPALNKLSLLPYFGLNGGTGTLYLQANGQIFRQLTWAQMQKGKPSRL